MRSPGAVARDLFAISKPRIMLLLVIVAWAAMAVAAGGFPDPLPLGAVTAAGILSTASSGALNHVLERDRDARMERTANRPVASGRLPVWAAVTYAAVVGAASFAVLWFPGMQLAAWLTLGAIAYYVLVYTVILKPTTAQNIVIGGAAGSFPALIGWSAVTGGLAWPAWVLALLVFVWTPAHFWALAILYKKEYAAGGYPMMPVVRGDESTLKQILFYSVLTLLVSLSLVPWGAAGLVYLAAALALGSILVVRAHRLRAAHGPTETRAFFLWTIMYLGTLLLALIVDRVLPWDTAVTMLG